MPKKVESSKNYSSIKVEQKSLDVVHTKVEQTSSKSKFRPGSFAELISK